MDRTTNAWKLFMEKAELQRSSPQLSISDLSPIARLNGFFPWASFSLNTFTTEFLVLRVVIMRAPERPEFKYKYKYTYQGTCIMFVTQHN